MERVEGLERERLRVEGIRKEHKATEDERIAEDRCLGVEGLGMWVAFAFWASDMDYQYESTWLI